MTENKKNSKKINNIIPHQAVHSITLRRDNLKKPSNLISEVIKQPIRINNNLPNRLERSQKFPKSSQIQKFNLNFSTSKNQEKFNLPPQSYNFKNIEANQPTIEPSQAIFELAYEKALQKQLKSNQINHLTKKSKKFNYKIQVGLIAIVMLVALLGYLNLQQNEKNFLLKENQKVGFNTSLPSYILPGYSNISQNFKKNNFTDYFKSNIDNQSYQINESKITSSNPYQVIKKFVLYNYGTYQKIKINKTIVYLSSTNNATWLNKNIWYKLNNHDKTLSIQQIISIVESV
jgi:hypothetical protein